MTIVQFDMKRLEPEGDTIPQPVQYDDDYTSSSDSTYDEENSEGENSDDDSNCDDDSSAEDSFFTGDPVPTERITRYGSIHIEQVVPTCPEFLTRSESHHIEELVTPCAAAATQQTMASIQEGSKTKSKKSRSRSKSKRKNGKKKSRSKSNSSNRSKSGKSKDESKRKSKRKNKTKLHKDPPERMHSLALTSKKQLYLPPSIVHESISNANMEGSIHDFLSPTQIKKSIKDSSNKKSPLSSLLPASPLNLSTHSKIQDIVTTGGTWDIRTSTSNLLDTEEDLLDQINHSPEAFLEEQRRLLENIEQNAHSKVAELPMEAITLTNNSGGSNDTFYEDQQKIMESIQQEQQQQTAAAPFQPTIEESVLNLMEESILDVMEPSERKLFMEEQLELMEKIKREQRSSEADAEYAQEVARRQDLCLGAARGVRAAAMAVATEIRPVGNYPQTKHHHPIDATDSTASTSSPGGSSWEDSPSWAESVPVRDVKVVPTSRGQRWTPKLPTVPKKWKKGRLRGRTVKAVR